MIFDAEGSIVGRLATQVAKEALRGNEVIVVNSEKAVLVGDPKIILVKYLAKRNSDVLGL